MNLHTPTHGLVIFTMFAGLAAINLSATGWVGVVFGSLLTLTPVGLTLLVSFCCQGTFSLKLVMVTNCLYAAWFAFTYVYTLDSPMGDYLWNDGNILFVLSGILSLPVLIPLWITALITRKKGLEPANSSQP